MFYCALPTRASVRAVTRMTGGLRITHVTGRSHTAPPSASLVRLFYGAGEACGKMQQQAQSCTWLELPHLRQMCQAGLNKSEQRHALTQAGCTFKRGRIDDHGLDAQEFRASGLNLVIAAIVYWNSTYLTDAIDHLRRQRHAVPAELLAHASPLTREHIGFSGDFLWGQAAATPEVRRPHRPGRPASRQGRAR